MKNDISIKQKNLLIIIILGTLIILLISYSFYSIQQLNKSSILLDESSKTILHNKEIIILHEQFVADLTRKFILNEPFEKKAQAHTKCILGTWLYPFLSSQEFKELPSSLQQRFIVMENTHKKIHSIAEHYAEGKDVKFEDIFIVLPGYIQEVISDLNSYNDYIEKIKNERLEKNNTLVLTIIMVYSILGILTIFAFIALGLLNKHTMQSLYKVQNGLYKFFDYLNKKTNQIEKLDESKNDEFGLIAAT